MENPVTTQHLNASDMAASAASEALMPEATRVYSNRQRLFLLYFVGTLIDLVVLGLFDEFSTKVYVQSFSILLLAAVLLQVLLKATIAVDHDQRGILGNRRVLKAVVQQASPADMWLGDDFHHNGAFRLSYGFEYAYMMESSKEITNVSAVIDRFAYWQETMNMPRPSFQ